MAAVKEMPRTECEDCAPVLAELRALRGGLIDTSTLIYGERLQVLPLLARQWCLVTIPQVVAEFGRHPEQMELLNGPHAGSTDEVLLATAIDLRLPLLSEDGRLLRRARARQHPHYNSLMLLLALLVQGQITLAEYDRLHAVLVQVARYSPAVLAWGQALLQALMQSMDESS